MYVLIGVYIKHTVHLCNGWTIQFLGLKHLFVVCCLATGVV